MGERRLSIAKPLVCLYSVSLKTKKFCSRATWSNWSYQNGNYIINRLSSNKISLRNSLFTSLFRTNKNTHKLFIYGHYFYIYNNMNIEEKYVRKGSVQNVYDNKFKYTNAAYHFYEMWHNSIKSGNTGPVPYRMWIWGKYCIRLQHIMTHIS